MNKDSIWVKIVIGIVAALLVSVGGIIIFEAHQYTQNVPESSYYVYGDYNVVDNLKPNLLYNQSSLENPSLIYNSITTSVNFSLYYDIQLNNMSGRDGVIVNSVTLVSKNPSWSKILSVNVTNLNGVMKDSNTVPIDVNMSSALNLANDIDGQLLSGNTAPIIILNMTIQISGVPRFNTSLQISLQDTTETLTYGTAQVLSSTQYKNELIVPNNLIGLNKDFGYIFVGSAGALGGLSAFLYIPRNNDPLKRIKNEFGDQIVEINSPVSNGATKIEKLDDLLKMSEIFEVPVFLYIKDKVLYINHQGFQYYYEII